MKCNQVLEEQENYSYENYDVKQTLFVVVKAWVEAILYRCFGKKNHGFTRNGNMSSTHSSNPLSVLLTTVLEEIGSQKILKIQN